MSSIAPPGDGSIELGDGSIELGDGSIESGDGVIESGDRSILPVIRNQETAVPCPYKSVVISEILGVGKRHCRVLHRPPGDGSIELGDGSIELGDG